MHVLPATPEAATPRRRRKCERAPSPSQPRTDEGTAAAAEASRRFDATITLVTHRQKNKTRMNSYRFFFPPVRITVMTIVIIIILPVARYDIV